MPGFLPLPGGLPWWAALAIMVPGAVYALLFLAMPFSVFGLKGRIEAVEARLDEIQEEIRSLALRLPEAGPASRPTNDLARRPPIAPSASDTNELPRLQSLSRGVKPERPTRSEPRLDWPR